jgi:hypothetical protein
MRGSLLKVPLLTAFIVAAIAPLCFAQSSKPRLGIGYKVSTLGFAIEAGTGISDKSNLRGGFNFGGFTQRRTRDGIDYTARLQFRSIEAHYDWFLWRGLRVSPGLLIYNDNHLDGSAVVPGGRQFTIGGNTYYSDPSDRANGPFRVDFGNKVAPMITAGLGNLLRRSGKRLSSSIEVGVVFEGSPSARLDLQGSVGPSPAGPFFSIASNPQVQADLRAEENKISSGAPPFRGLHSALKYYPVISIGMGFRIK